jgi:hypothetical protein
MTEDAGEVVVAGVTRHNDPAPGLMTDTCGTCSATFTTTMDEKGQQEMLAWYQEHGDD